MGSEMSAPRNRLGWMHTARESSKRIKGTAEQVGDIFSGLASLAQGSSWASAGSRPREEVLQEAVLLLAKHMDLMREHFIQEEIQGIQNRGMEKDSYWREGIEQQLGIAVLEEREVGNGGMDEADLALIRGTWIAAQTFDRPDPIERSSLRRLLAKHLTQLLDLAQAAMATGAGNWELDEAGLAEIRQTWEEAQTYDRPDPIDRSSLLKLLAKKLTPLLDLAEAGMQIEAGAPSV